MLLTREPVTTVEAALTLLRGYGYGWRIEPLFKDRGFYALSLMQQAL